MGRMVEVADTRLYIEERGELSAFPLLVFHGGPGTTLEMRLFSLPALEREFAAAGFAHVRVDDQAFPEYGIAWPVAWGVPIVARA